MNRFALISAAALTASVALICAPKAEAALIPTYGLNASATGPVSGAAGSTTAVVTAVLSVSDGPAFGTYLVSNAVPGRVTGVTIDGKPIATGAYETTATAGPERSRLVVRVNDDASAAPLGSLSDGNHTIGITTDLIHAGDGPLGVELETSGASAAIVARASTTIPLPDLRVSAPTDPRVNGSLSLTPGGETFFFAEVKRRSAIVRASTMTITLPAGLELDPRHGVLRFDADTDGSELRCTIPAAHTLSCPLGVVDDEVDVGLDLAADPSTRSGTSGTLAIHVEAANGLDATPGDNTSRSTVRFVQPAHLRTTLTTGDKTVEVGSSTRLIATVTNTGTEPVTVFGVVAVGTELGADDEKTENHFDITGFTGRDGLPDPGDVTSAASAMSRAMSGAMSAAVTVGGGGTTDVRAMARQTRSTDAAKSDPRLRFWNIGTLAPGADATAVLTVRAKSVGPGAAVVLATSPSGVSSCLQHADDESSLTKCPEVGYVALRAVAGAGTDGSGTIAATGVPTIRLTLLGVALLLLGGLALYAGSQHTRPTGRHRT